MRTLRSRGFTLAELLVGLSITSILMVAVTAAVIGVQNAYQAETEVKIVTENGRTALMYLERVVPLVGYGVDPRLGVDVSDLQGGTVPRDNFNVTTASFTPAQPPLDGGTVITDDLAFRYRDPAWLRAGRLSGTSLTVDTPFGVELPEGKLLLVVCRGATRMWAGRVNSTAAAADVTVDLTMAGAPWVNATDNCLTGTGTSSPWVFMVHEQRLRIVNMGGRPWLVAFRDLTADPSDLTLDNFDPIAADIENFQVAFGVNRAPPAACCQTAPDTGLPGDWVFGNSFSGGTPEPVFPQPANVLTTLPGYETSYADPTRFIGHPANIRSVHIAFTVRSTRRDPTSRRASSPEDLFNYNAPASLPDGWTRSTFHTTINTPNILSRSFFLPELRSASDLRDLNSWGG